MSNDVQSSGPLKRAALLKLLEKDVVMVILDGRREGVVLPEWLVTQPQVCLDLGYNMPVPIDDLRLLDTHIEATLSFSRQPFTCTIPWDAVYALRPHRVGEGMVWPNDVPSELLDSTGDEGVGAETGRAKAARGEDGRERDGGRSKARGPRAVEAQPGRERRPTAAAAALRVAGDEPTRPSRPGLRLVPAEAEGDELAPSSVASQPTPPARPTLHIVK